MLMNTEIKVPQLPDGTESAFIADIYVKDGDIVGLDQALLDVETDKIVLEIIAPNSGVVSGFNLLQGQTVKSEQVLFRLEPSDDIVTEKLQTTTQDSIVETSSKSTNTIGLVFAVSAVVILIFLFI
jgi:2-oxoglutarate dehydrogenase E2 component (dihydrolipoamide succinyltransferase)